MTESPFMFFLELGFKHMADFRAYDHMLFLIALCAIYRIHEWKRVLILATAFTVGHSVTLGLAVFEVIKFNQPLIETLIAVTILLTCLYNIFSCSKHTKGEKVSPTRVAYHTRQLMVSYAIAFLFGLIHGMGFSNLAKDTAMMFEENNLALLLFGFNVGLELAQLLIVAVILIIAYFVMDILKVRQRVWNVTISSMVGLMALGLIFGWL